MTERQSQSNKKKSNLKHIFQVKKRDHSGFWFAGRKLELTSVYCAGTYIWIEETIAYSNLDTRYFSKKKDYSGSFWFVTRIKPNLSSTTSVFSAGTYICLDLD